MPYSFELLVVALLVLFVIAVVRLAEGIRERRAISSAEQTLASAQRLMASVRRD